ncbi:hypothetical protein B0H19DRAFT_1131768 [Mycena capillaripes]|nr:hypothetical protein B0H19DRAFT_1131768 [Mycena capillaripes]
MDSFSSSSSTVMSADLGLDPSDPLNLLLHNHSQHDGPDTDTDSAATPPDWNSLSSMWPPVDDHKMDFAMDFGLMDMSFDPAVGIEPSALNYTYAPDPFQFTFESPHLSSRSSSESGSTSGSFSPRAAYSPPASEFDEDPATELASRVRKAAGVVLAVQINQEQQQQQQQQQQQRQVQQQQQQPTPSYTPPPPAFTTTPVAAPVLANSPVTAAPPSRPKTSHTTIERRYRTNLNARIQSLRQAVPALRVVDRAAALKAGEPVDDDGPEDIVDSRGFVDGVKVARKCSKANVLGKAVEYIRVLKNRETRLARELAGLKTLLGGLVGGRELLHEWEREWAARFGGPETDEVSEGGAPADEDAEEDEEDSDADDGGAGRKRKKPKVAAAAAADSVKPKPERKPAAPPPADGEKKKRGRPRKVVPLPASALAPALSTSVPMQAQMQTQTHESPQRQYLLGAFALFSFFANTNLSGPQTQTAHHGHEGHVLTHTPVRAEGVGLLQMFHLLVSVAVLASVLLPIGKSVYAHLRGASSSSSKKPSPVVVLEKQAPSSPRTPTSEDDDTSDADADTDLSLSSISGDDEPATAPSCSAPAPHLAAAEACILDDSTPLTTRLRTALRLYNSLSSSTDDDRRLLALLVQPIPLLGARVAGRLWGSGMGMGVGVEEAARRVAASSSSPTTPSSSSPTSASPKAEKGVLRTLEETLALERLRSVAAQAFARQVLGSNSDSAPDSDANATAKRETEERERALALARSLSERVSALGARLPESDVDVDGDAEGTADDVEKLLRAIVLHRHVFDPSTPPLASKQDALALRRTLGSSDVFEDALVEEARDRVVDLLTGQ